MSEPIAQELAGIATAVHGLIQASGYWQEVAPEHLSGACLSYLGRGGKCLRSGLLVWASRLCGGRDEQAYRAAAAVEVFHTWTLVHDDIIDRDERRRGGPTVHAQAAAAARRAGASEPEAAHYGTTVGILAGDLQHGWAVELLSGLPAESAWPELLGRLEGQTLRRVIGGEMLDVDLARRALEEVTERDLLQVIAWKTAELFAYCGWAGARLGQGSPADCGRLERFGRELGMAFQLRDDVLGLVGDSGAMGKPVGSDLREGKRTLPLLAAWAQAGAQEREIITRALQPKGTAAERAEAIRVVVARGGVAAAQARAEQHLGLARAELEPLPATPPRARLGELARMLVERDR